MKEKGISTIHFCWVYDLWSFDRFPEKALNFTLIFYLPEWWEVCMGIIEIDQIYIIFRGRCKILRAGISSNFIQW